ncbi:amidohydrolase family protein [Pseudoxanthomonas sp. 3HH-4]|uniref:amidohydrolase family protein n=1 Tax=Pseudoxanthomonas sp. 3HH-4 TaxID=1690214 RepID=UPI00163A27B6|nr:amidohydrolase family protein [Pseudoxanthomonas sp. 3HH-4]
MKTETACAQTWVIERATVIASPDAAPLADAVVVVRDGRIASVGSRSEVKVPDDARRIDAAGRVLVAGFWNSHVHFLLPGLTEVAEAPAPVLELEVRSLLSRWGFTSVFDLGGLPGNARSLRARIDAGELRGPRILTVDAPFYPADGTPHYVRDVMKQHGAPSAEVATPEQARVRARTQLEEGADGAKLFIGALVGGPRGVVHMTPAIAGAVAETAHALGRPVFAHPSTTQGLEIALQAGVDVLAHSTPIDGPWPEDMAERLVAADVALVPSLKLFEVELRKESLPPPVIERFLGIGQQQLRAFREAGGQVLFGTDVGYITDSDPHREYALMAGAGMDWRAILASLTTEPARRFGHAARSGRIAPGMDADLVLLGHDPATEVLALADVVWVMRAGEIQYEAAE